jgi:hypothetical protein
MKPLSILTFVIFFALISATAIGQVVVSGSVGADGNYQTLKGAFDAINANPQADNFIDVAITADIVETATAQLNAGGWTSLRVHPGPQGARTIQGNISDVWDPRLSRNDPAWVPPTDAVIKLNGADNVSIDGEGVFTRSLFVTNTNVSGIGILITSAGDVDGATNNTIRNTIVTGVQDDASDGGAVLIVGFTENVSNDNNLIEGCLISDASYGVWINHGFTNTFDHNWNISGNIFGSTNLAFRTLRKRAISLHRASQYSIGYNTVRGLTGQGSGGTPVGIFVNLSENGNIYNNRVSDVKQVNLINAPQGGLCSFATGVNLNSAGFNRVANNFIWDVAATGDCPNGGFAVRGLMIGGGDYDVFNNSINMNTNTGKGHYSTALYLNGGGFATVHNNILANPSTSGQRVSIVAFPDTFSGDLNYNNYYSSQSVGYFCGVIVRAKDCFRKTLTNWRAAVGQDANSVSLIPGFVSATDLHLLGSSQMINRGRDIPTVLDDIDGQPRGSSTWDIGADEYVP